MKNIKRITAPLAAIFAAATVFMFAACSDHGAPDYSVADPQFVTELSEFERDYTDKLERFMDGQRKPHDVFGQRGIRGEIFARRAFRLRLYRREHIRFRRQAFR